MEQTKVIRQRDQIPAEDKWAIEDLYASDELWEQELSTVVRMSADSPELWQLRTADCL